MLKKPVRADIFLYPPDKRKRDIDNVLKCLFDVLQHGGAIEDDALIRELYVKVRWVYAPDGLVEISLSKPS